MSSNENPHVMIEETKKVEGQATLQTSDEVTIEQLHKRYIIFIVKHKGWINISRQNLMWPLEKIQSAAINMFFKKTKIIYLIFASIQDQEIKGIAQVTSPSEAKPNPPSFSIKGNETFEYCFLNWFPPKKLKFTEITAICNTSEFKDVQSLSVETGDKIAHLFLMQTVPDPKGLLPFQTPILAPTTKEQANKINQSLNTKDSITYENQEEDKEESSKKKENKLDIKNRSDIKNVVKEDPHVIPQNEDKLATQAKSPQKTEKLPENKVSTKNFEDTKVKDHFHKHSHRHNEEHHSHRHRSRERENKDKKQKEEQSGDEIDWNSDLIPHKQLEENDAKHHHSSRERDRKRSYYKDSNRDKERNQDRDKDRDRRKDYDRGYPSKPSNPIDQDTLRQAELVESKETEKLKKELEEKLKSVSNYTISLGKKNNDIRKLDSGINKPLDPPK